MRTSFLRGAPRHLWQGLDAEVRVRDVAAMVVD